MLNERPYVPRQALAPIHDGPAASFSERNFVKKLTLSSRPQKTRRSTSTTGAASASAIGRTRSIESEKGPRTASATIDGQSSKGSGCRSRDSVGRPRTAPSQLPRQLRLSVQGRVKGRQGLGSAGAGGVVDGGVPDRKWSDASVGTAESTTGQSRLTIERKPRPPSRVLQPRLKAACKRAALIKSMLTPSLLLQDQMKETLEVSEVVQDAFSTFRRSSLFQNVSKRVHRRSSTLAPVAEAERGRRRSSILVPKGQERVRRRSSTLASNVSVDRVQGRPSTLRPITDDDQHAPNKLVVVVKIKSMFQRFGRRGVFGTRRSSLVQIAGAAMPQSVAQRRASQMSLLH